MLKKREIQITHWERKCVPYNWQRNHAKNIQSREKDRETATDGKKQRDAKRHG